MSREKFPGEVTYLNTEEWRAMFGAWLDKEGTGARERLKEQLGVNHGTLSKLLSGKIAKSTLIGPISRMAGVPVPRRLTDAVAETAAALADIKSIDPDAFENFRELILSHRAARKTKP